MNVYELAKVLEEIPGDYQVLFNNGLNIVVVETANVDDKNEAVILL